MSTLQYRGSIARAAVVIALLSSRPAGAQVVVAPGAPQQHGGLVSAFTSGGQPGGKVNNVVTGVAYDAMNQAMAERHLEKRQAKLRRDAERGDLAAVDRDAWRIASYKERILVDEWLIRKNSLQDPGYYPFPLRLDPVSCAAIAEYTHPPLAPGPLGPVPTPGPEPMAAAPTIPITIINAEPAGPGVAFAVDGVTYQSAGGSRQDLAVPPDSMITYDAGGSLGQRRYRISPGLFEFRSTPEGWALYKLPSMP